MTTMVIIIMRMMQNMTVTIKNGNCDVTLKYEASTSV